MRGRLAGAAFLLALGLGVLPSTAAHAAAQSQSNELIREYPEEIRGSWRRLSWEAVDGRPGIEGLSVMELAARGMVERLLLRFPVAGSTPEARVVSTVTVEPRDGEHQFLLRDDTGDWWAELTLQYGRRWNGLRHYVRTAGGAVRERGGLGFHLRTSDGIDIDGEAGPGESGWVDEASLLAALDEIGVVARLGAAVPKDLHRPLEDLRRYWEANPSGAGVRHQTLIDLLAVINGPDRDATLREARARRADEEGGLVNTLFKPVRGVVGLWDDLWSAGDDEVEASTAKGTAGSTWKEGRSRPAAGTVIQDPSALSWLEAFETVPSPDPLADRRLSEVIPGRTP